MKKWNLLGKKVTVAEEMLKQLVAISIVEIPKRPGASLPYFSQIK